MHARKFFLRCVGPGDKVAADVDVELIKALSRNVRTTGVVLPKTKGKARVGCRYKRRGGTPGEHIVLVGLTTEVVVHSKQLFEIEGWRVRVPGEPAGGPPSDAPPFPVQPVRIQLPWIQSAIAEELYVAMKARRDRFMKSRRTPVPEVMQSAYEIACELRQKTKRT